MICYFSNLKIIFTSKYFGMGNQDCRFCNTRLNSIFRDLNPEEAEKLNEIKICNNYKKGSYIFVEGASPNGLFCVNNGKVKIIQTGVDGKEQIIHFANNGDVLGYRAILSGDTYSCSAITMEDSSLCYIPKSFFMQMVESNSKLTLRIFMFFSDMLKDSEKKITNIAQRSVKERLAQSILLLKESYGFEADGRTINLSITREEMANIAGTTRETAIRILSDLQNENAIELNGKKISISNLQLLVKVANVFD